MRKFIVLAIYLTVLTLNVSEAQTNIFPNSGKVGIGTTSPKEKLHLTGNSLIEGNYPFIKIRDTNGRGSANLYLQRGNESRDRAQVVFGNNDDVKLWYAGLTYRCGRVEEGFHISRKASLYNCSNWYEPQFSISKNGNVGIGIRDPSSKLTINGTAKAEEVIVEEDVGADFVFEEDYPLPDLAELEAFIQSNNHLPEIPSAEEMKRNGVKVGEFQIRLLQKIEELTLYVIEQKKQVRRQKIEFQNQLQQQKRELKKLKRLIQDEKTIRKEK